VSAFPIDQWFDTSKRISKAERHLAEEQIAFYAAKDAMKDGGDPSKEANKAIAELRCAVKQYNAKFPATCAQ